MEGSWSTYSEAAEKLGVSRQAVRQKAIRGHWPRTRGNDGQARVQLPEQPYRVRTPFVPASTTPERGPDLQLEDALKAHIDKLKSEFLFGNVQLKGELAHLRDELAQRDAQLVTERERADRAVAELFDVTQQVAIAETQLTSERERADWATERFTGLAQQLADVTAAYAKEELATLQAKPWWRRLLGAA
jgi:DNA primase